MRHLPPAHTLRSPARHRCPPPSAGNLQSTGFDPKESLRAHRAVWPNAAVALGVEIPPEGEPLRRAAAARGS